MDFDEAASACVEIHMSVVRLIRLSASPFNQTKISFYAIPAKTATLETSVFLCGQVDTEDNGMKKKDCAF
ncbi:MAG: hypothetical protein ACR2L1_06360 [Pyrinomonadaceae bacterium]